MVRGLALARLCPTGSLDVAVTCMDGSKVECTIRVQTVHSLLTVVIYIRGAPAGEGSISHGRSRREGALIII